MDGIGQAVGEAIVGMVILAAIVGAAIATLLIFGVPWLWGILKPIIHAWTGP